MRNKFCKFLDLISDCVKLVCLAKLDTR